MKASTKRGGLSTLGFLISLTIFIGLFDSWATLPEIKGWYSTLNKPAFNPPNAIFGPVWTTLYLLMSVSMWLNWNSTTHAGRNGKIYFFSMLGLNAIWSPLFFGLHRPDLALIVIGLYLVFLAAWVKSLAHESGLAAALQIPHILWVSFATVLNASIWLLN